MASAEEIKARIGSIRQTKKVTDAMYMISSVKMAARAKTRSHQHRTLFQCTQRADKVICFFIFPETNNRYFRVFASRRTDFSPQGIAACHFR